jgi:hypothetical protein
MDWSCGSSSRVLAWQAGSPKLKTQSHKREKERDEEGLGERKRERERGRDRGREGGMKGVGRNLLIRDFISNE